MSGGESERGAGVSPALDHDLSPGEPARKRRRRRAPTPAELVLLRWLAAKPRPVTMGPIGNCVKRGWCEPVRAVVDDDDGRRLSFIFVVTEAGARLIERHGPGGAAEAGRPATEAVQADEEEAGDGATGTRSRSAAVDPERQ